MAVPIKIGASINNATDAPTVGVARAVEGAIGLLLLQAVSIRVFTVTDAENEGISIEIAVTKTSSAISAVAPATFRVGAEIRTFKCITFAKSLRNNLAAEVGLETAENSGKKFVVVRLHLKLEGKAVRVKQNTTAIRLAEQEHMQMNTSVIWMLVW
jgi:hypothetical protein